jgi:hypothetical protein
LSEAHRQQEPVRRPREVLRGEVQVAVLSSYSVIVPSGIMCPGRCAARSEAQCCAADPGPLRLPNMERSRISGAPLR